MLALAAGRSPCRMCCRTARFPSSVGQLDSHAGFGLVRMADRIDAGGLSYRAPGKEFFLSPFVNYASPDGMFRKYRLVVVDGKPYACHMAIADEWKVWYLNADMAVSVPHRLEEAALHADDLTGLRARHHARRWRK